MTPKGIMVHSTGAENPWLKRYVGPDDGLLGKNQYNNRGTGRWTAGVRPASSGSWRRNSRHLPDPPGIW